MNRRTNRFGITAAIAIIAALPIAASLPAVRAASPECCEKKAPGKRSWCKEHSKWEDECEICHPELAEKKQAEAPTPQPGEQSDPHPGGEHDHAAGETHGSDSRQTTKTEATTVAADRQPPTPQRDPNRLWCREHDRYEDECYICHPELDPNRADNHEDHDHARHDHAKEQSGDPTHDDRADHGDDDHDDHAGHDHGDDAGETHSYRGSMLWCNEHNLAETNCGICQPQLAARLRPGEWMGLRLPSTASADKAGIRISSPKPADIAATIDVYCEVHYNQNRLASITPLVTGVVDKVHFDVGQQVRAGDLLAEIASPQVATAKQEFLVALVDQRLKELALEREQKLSEKEISAVRNLQQARAEYEMARITSLSSRQRLVNYGFTEAEVDEIAETNSSSSIVHVHAPFDGVLVERYAVLGQRAEPGTPIFTLADLSTMWLTMSVPETQVGLLRSGMKVEASFSALPGLIATGEIIWVDTTVTEPSRMVRTRARIQNADRALRNNMFGNARVLVGRGSTSLSVPVRAVQRFERNPFVFVKREPDLFELRRVMLGSASENRVQVVDGLRETDEIVVDGSFTMMSEFLKSRLGAGCVHD